MQSPYTTMSYVPPFPFIDVNGLEKDKKNYLSYYKRALSYLGLSRYHAAISDLNSVLAIQPDFSAALVQRGKILAWQGDFVNAVKDLRKAGKQDDFVPIPDHEVYS
jgi:tetratricopeptide (TPR) repeat protein